MHDTIHVSVLWPYMHQLSTVCCIELWVGGLPDMASRTRPRCTPPGRPRRHLPVVRRAAERPGPVLQTNRKVPVVQAGGRTWPGEAPLHVAAATRAPLRLTHAACSSSQPRPPQPNACRMTPSTILNLIKSMSKPLFGFFSSFFLCFACTWLCLPCLTRGPCSMQHVAAARHVWWNLSYGMYWLWWARWTREPCVMRQSYLPGAKDACDIKAQPRGAYSCVACDGMRRRPSLSSSRLRTPRDCAPTAARSQTRGCHVRSLVS